MITSAYGWLLFISITSGWKLTGQRDNSTFHNGIGM